VRWDEQGNLKGSHIQFLGRVLNDSNVVLASQPMPPESVTAGTDQGFPLSEVLEQVQIDALKTIDTLNAQIDTLTTEINALKQKLATYENL
jgi:hypothetical protein